MRSAVFTASDIFATLSQSTVGSVNDVYTNVSITARYQYFVWIITRMALGQYPFAAMSPVDWKTFQLLEKVKEK